MYTPYVIYNTLKKQLTPIGKPVLLDGCKRSHHYTPMFIISLHNDSHYVVKLHVTQKL